MASPKSIKSGASKETPPNKVKAPTVDAWLAALESACSKSPSEGLSVADLTQQLGWGMYKVRRWLRQSIEDGTVICLGHVGSTRGIDGRICRVPLYMLKSKIRT